MKSNLPYDITFLWEKYGNYYWKRLNYKKKVNARMQPHLRKKAQQRIKVKTEI